MKRRIRQRIRTMKQFDLLDWLDENAVIKSALPSNAIQHREWLKAQLEVLMMELDHLQISPLAISEALSFYANAYAEKAQQNILKPESK